MHFMDPKWQKKCSAKYMIAEFLVIVAIVGVLFFFLAGCAIPNESHSLTNDQIVALHTDRPSLEERYGYTYEQYKKLIRHLVLLGKVEERVVFAYRTHYDGGYDAKDNSKYWTFEVVKKVNDPSEGLQLHAYVIKYFPADSEGKRKTEWRRNWVFFDDNMDGYPDRYVTSFWSVGENGKLKIQYNPVKHMEDTHDTKWEEIYYNLRHHLWSTFIKKLMHKPFNYYPEKPKEETN